MKECTQNSKQNTKMSYQPQRYRVSNCVLGLFTTVEATAKHTHHDEDDPTQYNRGQSLFKPILFSYVL